MPFVLDRNSVIQADLDESVETVIAGAQRKNAVLSAKEKEIVAYHEIGHALVAAKQTDSAPVHQDYHRAAHLGCTRLHHAGG